MAPSPSSVKVIIDSSPLVGVGLIKAAIENKNTILTGYIHVVASCIKGLDYS